MSAPPKGYKQDAGRWVMQEGDVEFEEPVTAGLPDTLAIPVKGVNMIVPKDYGALNNEQLLNRLVELNPDADADALAQAVRTLHAASGGAITADASGSWTAEPLIAYGQLTRDGRMIRAGSLSVPDPMPVPLMSMLEDAHGGFADPTSVLAGSIDGFQDTADGLNASGQIDDSDAGLAALEAARDGRMGISADLAIEEYEFVLPADQVPEDADEEGIIILADADAEDTREMSEDVPDSVVVEHGNVDDYGVFVVTRAQVMGATIVPFAAFEATRIDVTSLTSDGAPHHVRVTTRLKVQRPSLEALRAALELKAITKNEARRLLGLRRMRGGDA